MNDSETPVRFQMVRKQCPITIIIGLLLVGIALFTSALLLEPSGVGAAMLGFGLAAVMIAVILGLMGQGTVIVQVTKIGITIAGPTRRATYTWDRIQAIELAKPLVFVSNDRILKIRLKRKLPWITDSLLVRVEQPDALIAAARPYLVR